MKLLLFTTFVATLCYVNAGKTNRLLAAMIANGALANGANPALLAAGLNTPIIGGGAGGIGVGAGLIGQPQIGQPQFAQFFPGVPAFALPAPVPNMYPVNAYQFPFMGVPQMAPMAPMAPMNAAQQPAVGVAGGAMPQQVAPQPGPLTRFRRQLLKQKSASKATEDTQIPTPTDTTATTICKEQRQEDN